MLFHHVLVEHTRGYMVSGALLWFLLLSSSLKPTIALIELPDNVRVESEVTITSPQTQGYATQSYSVEEYVNKKDGSIHLKVKDLSNRRPDAISYYRIKQVQPERSFQLSDDFVIAYRHEDLRCQSARLAEWRLKELSSTMDLLIDAASLPEASDWLKSDRTAIGPAALLRYIQLNAPSFILQAIAYDQGRLNDMLHFVVTIPPSSNGTQRQTTNIIVSVPSLGVEGLEYLATGQNSLTAVDSTRVFPAQVTIGLFDESDQRTESDPMELLNAPVEQVNYTRLIINYHLIQERSTRRHLGMRVGSSEEQNPFTLPVGAGCGSTSIRSSQLFYVGAKQFSGIYQARDLSANRFMAYDENTKHLRIDSIGDHKIIYDLKSRRMTYVDDLASLVATGEQEPARCVQSYQQDVEQDDIFHEVKGIEHILGLTEFIGLTYLGTKSLEDGTQCLMFEREVSPSQIPLISRMNLRLSITSGHRFFLVYYFVDELSIETGSTVNEPLSPSKMSHESMWLKRVELISLSSLSRYKILNSRVTFSEFTWSLESVAEEEFSREAKIRHPVRTFDTIECKPLDEQTQLDLVVRQMDTSDFFAANKSKSNELTPGMKTASQLESIEESMIVIISQHTGLSRSQIGELELVLPPGDSNQVIQFDTLAIRAKIFEPMAFSWERSLLGWIYSIDAIPFGRYGTLVRSEAMARHECSLKLATAANLDKTMNMIYCPNVGCGYINDLESFDYIKKSGLKEAKDTPKLSDNYYLCEIHGQTREVTYKQADSMRDNNFSNSVIERVLNNSRVTIVTDTQINSPIKSDAPIFRGVITKVSTTVGVSLESIGDLLKQDVCFTNKFPNLGTMISQLRLDAHQSVVYCHRACLLQPNCQTYSYNKESRVCTLTSLSRKTVNSITTDDKLIVSSSSCAIYAPNPVRNFKTVTELMLNRLDSLSKTLAPDYYVLMGNLSQCAELCHSHELSCSRFYFFPLNNFCILEDKESSIFKSVHASEAGNYSTEEDRRKHFIGLVGGNDWLAFHKSQQYKRDYSQHFVIKQQSKVDSEGMNKLQLVKEDTQVDGDQFSYSLVPGPELYGKLIDDDSCLRECSTLRHDCLMVDHCVKPINGSPTRVCTIYLLSNSNETIDAASNDSRSLVTKTIGSESMYDDILITFYGCTHYHFSGDDLLLRVQLMEQNQTQVDGQFEEEASQAAAEDFSNSGRYINYLRRGAKLIEPFQVSGDQMSILTIIILVLAGITTSLLASFYGSHMREVTSTFIAHAARDAQIMRRNRRANRSPSKVEFNELGDIHA